MLNPLRRLTHRDRATQARFDLAPMMGRDTAPGIGTSDDYHVEGDAAADQPSTAMRIVHGMQIVLIFVLAVLSFAVFWLIGLMLNIL